MTSSVSWQQIASKQKIGIDERNKERKYKKIEETKYENLIKKYPKKYADFLKYVRNLDFKDQPDYFYLKSLFGINEGKTFQFVDKLELNKSTRRFKISET